MSIQIKRENYSINLGDPILYVDNESRQRSGHMSHAMAEFKKGSFIDFNSNCSGFRFHGHFPYGCLVLITAEPYPVLLSKATYLYSLSTL